MSNLIVITFDDALQATQAYESLKSMESGGYVNLDDAAVIVKDEAGKVHLHNRVDKGIIGGAVGGSMVGLLIASVFFPFAGIIIGGVGGALIGKSLHKGVDQDFVKEVTESLQPNSSALFLMVKGTDPGMVIATLRPYKGKVLQTTLTDEALAALQDTLKKRE